MGANMLVEFEIKFFIGGISFKLGAMGANVLVELKMVLSGGISFLIVNDPSLTIVNDNPSLTIVNDNPFVNYR